MLWRFMTMSLHHRNQDKRTLLGLWVWLYMFFFFFRRRLEGIYQSAMLKIATWLHLTQSQLCLSPSHLKHSPTLMPTPSRWGRPFLNTGVDEAWLTEKGNLNYRLFCCWQEEPAGRTGTVWHFLCFLRLQTVREKSPAVKGSRITEIPTAFLAPNHPGRGCLEPEEDLLALRLVICQNGSVGVKQHVVYF